MFDRKQAVLQSSNGDHDVAAVLTREAMPERHLRHVLLSYMKYHNQIRTHLSLEKDAPVSRAVKLAGTILCRPVLGGLHHQYVRI